LDNAGGKGQIHDTDNPSLNNTVSRRISEMAGDVVKQLLLCTHASELYALQLDESTDVVGLAQLLVYVRYIYGGSIKEDILLLQTTGNQDNMRRYF
jgi:hypothetical protein